MSKHTPGPWIARKVNGSGWPEQRGYAIDFNEDQEQVVDFVYEEADAWLIAAAPELLEACLLLVADYEDENSAIGDDWYRKAKAAIAKARGEA
ncbi:hypothetical protein D9M68_982250 [compost metagenome]